MYPSLKEIQRGLIVLSFWCGEARTRSIWRQFMQEWSDTQEMQEFGHRNWVWNCSGIFTTLQWSRRITKYTTRRENVVNIPMLVWIIFWTIENYFFTSYFPHFLFLSHYFLFNWKIKGIQYLLTKIYRKSEVETNPPKRSANLVKMPLKKNTSHPAFFLFVF